MNLENTDFIINKLLKNCNQYTNIRFLTIDSETVTFTFITDKKYRNEIIINIGFQKIAKNYFKRSIPSESEVEYAINYIEDELMRFKELINNGEVLFSNNEIIMDIFSSQNSDKNEYSRQTIENLFTKYANLSMNNLNISTNLDITHEKYAILLILREIMHHLDFEKIYLVN